MEGTGETDSLAEGAVTSEPVLWSRKFPASRENTGNFIGSGFGGASTAVKKLTES